MSSILFIDIPVARERWDSATRKTVNLRYMAQDCINLLAKVPKPFQSRRKQFSRGILCIAKFIEDMGHKTKYLREDSIDSGKTLEKELKNIDFVGVTGNNTAYFNSVRKICKMVKNIDKDVPVVVGGNHVASLDRQILEKYNEIDVIVRGEGEKPFSELVEGTPFSKIKGIAFRDKKQVKRNEEQKPLNPEEIPSPSYHLLPGDPEEYNYNVQTIRGCIYRCSFCTNGFFWKNPRFVPLDKVMEEMFFLNSVLKPTTLIHFSDNIFSLNRKRAIELCNRLQRENLDLLFSCDLRANHTDTELIKTMDKSNFVKISLGFEDTNNKVLQKSNKGLTFEQNIQAAKIIKRNSDILLEAYWIIGLPGSSHTTVIENINDIKQILRNNVVDVISSSTVFTPLPGTPIFENPEMFGIKLLSKNWDNYLRSCFISVYELENLSQKDLYNYFIMFESFILKEYLRKLGVNIEQLKRLHNELMSEENEIEMRRVLRDDLEKSRKKL